ncbi:glutathione synthase/RimK-type ligase-like ATP-grasp enzyme [Microbacterium sp. AK009]|uniref:carbamoyl-phosphate synthase large subunit n=1 Tax=Microbacterium sp. AK009 TaxID=2723068 RepID=UPI0015CA471E|nr:carbamoyl-phosphate synthase large subunit [Microbacterium sp. AK009]NYF16835.1 glutathione synthase/RimK-type ligase-like ATP-grasp enzyme [Microbacterium sp. AK009]
MRILVTSSRNTFALDLIRKLGSIGHTVYASDTYGGAVGSHSRFAAGHLVTSSPRFATDAFIAEVSAFVTAHEIDVVIPTFEEVFYLAARRNDLPEGVRVLTGTFGDLARLHDKASFQRLAEEAGVPIPETVVVTSDEELVETIARFPRYFARAAFSRGGVGLLTNTGPLAGKTPVDECHPTPEQPWLVQPFVDGPMVCSYSIIVDGRVTAHTTYVAAEQWAHSTAIAFLAVDSTDTLGYAQRIVDSLDPGFTGQLSFDFVDHGDGLRIIECNPRPTNGIILLDAADVGRALTGDVEEPVVAEPGAEREITLAVVADCFAEPLSHLPTSLHDLLHVKDVGSGWHDSLAMMWSPATIVHGAKIQHGDRKDILAALGDDIVWNGEPIDGMSSADAAALDAVHAGRV